MAHPADRPGPLVFVADVDHPELADDDRHHLERVLRVRVGDERTVGDGRGRWRVVRLGPALEVVGEVESSPPSAPELAVAFAVVKGDKPELVVQKLTELGIDRIVPFRAERSVVRWDDTKAAKAVVRMRAVARSAAAQCHRPWLPEVAEVTDLAGLVGAPGVAAADREGGPIASGCTTLLVGPEGGWAPGELPPGTARVGLGPHVLRAETAAIAAGVLLAATRG